MIFITGGAFQGKQAYARALSGLEEEAFLRRTADGTVLRKEGESGSTAKALAGKTILVNYQGFVRQALERGEDVLDMTRQVLALEPDLLLLDEPFSALDYQTRLAVSDDISSIIRSTHKTAILITHDLSEAISIADRILVLSARPGQIKYSFEVEFPPEYNTPLKRRNAPEFSRYFNLLWEQLKF